MRFRFLGNTLPLVVLLVAGAIARGDAAADRQWSVAWLSQPTLVGSTIVEGPVMFVHDEAAMRRGEPCTRIYLFEPATGPAEEVASFHCTPVTREVASKFTLRTRRNTELGYGCVLTEYQFARDTVAHRVPLPAIAH
jgi:hypothetical protein